MENNVRYLWLVASLVMSVPLIGWSQGVSKSTRHYDVAAFVWPAYHPDDRAKIFWPDGIGEWQTVMSNRPKYEGHEQDRQPLWGYINEADPYVAEMEISVAADHGVNVFIFDWYWYDGMPFVEGHLNDGYLKARNNDRVKFYLMWANHDVPLLWDIRNSDEAVTEKWQAKIWEGGLDRAEFEKVALRIIKKYFSHPSYYKIDGKPVFMIYELTNLFEGLGGVSQTREALQWFRARVKEAGFPGLELQLVLGSDRRISGPAADKKVVHTLGFDSLTHYQFFHFTDVNRDYDAIIKDTVSEWQTVSAEYSPKYYPHVSIGWDSSPRYKKRLGSVVKNASPAKFEAALQKARAFIDAHPDRAPLITINSWNEWTETSYLQPDTRNGYGYLDAVKQVFRPEGLHADGK